MVDKKVIGISSLGAIMTALIIIGVTQGNPFYYCEVSRMVTHCDNVTDTVCYNVELGNLYCNDGWFLIVDDEVASVTIDELYARLMIVNESFYDYDSCVSSCNAYCFYEGQEFCDCGLCEAEQEMFNSNKESDISSILLSIEVLS